MRGVATVCLVALVSMAQEAPDPRFPTTLKEWTLVSLINPDELGDLYEGDIEPPLTSWEERSGLINQRFRWPGATVPYEVDSNFSKDNTILLEAAMKEYDIRTNSCITWVKRNQEADYVKFIPHGNRCSSNVGKIGGMQSIYLPSKCFSKFGTILHEMLHALGFHHEQCRTDRDDYVTIMWQNIRKGHSQYFKKYPSDKVDPFGVPYDYGSVMHYSAYAFTANKNKTIVPKEPNAVIGQRDGLSDKDVRKVMNMYNCSANK